MMIALAVKNTILMALIILIMHFAIKNNMMASTLRIGPTTTELYCADPPPQAADIREAMHDELKRFVFEEHNDDFNDCDDVCDPTPTCQVSCSAIGSCPPPMMPPPLGTVAVPSCEDDDISCFNEFDSCYGSW
jgi:hypothetical protein